MRYDLRTSWFIPGHSLETFPEQTQMVVDAGHEIGVHGYSHEITGHPGVRWLTLDEIARDFGHRRPGPDA